MLAVSIPDRRGISTILGKENKIMQYKLYYYNKISVLSKIKNKMFYIINIFI